MLACAVFNEQNKGPVLPSIITWFVLRKQNLRAKKVYCILYDKKEHQLLSKLSVDYLSLGSGKIP